MRVTEVQRICTMQLYEPVFGTKDNGLLSPVQPSSLCTMLTLLSYILKHVTEKQ